MKKRKSISKRIIIIIAVLIFILIITGPIIINIVTPSRNKRNADTSFFTPSDLLSYYGSILSFLGVVVLGALALNRIKLSMM